MSLGSFDSRATICPSSSSACRNTTAQMSPSRSATRAKEMSWRKSRTPSSASVVSRNLTTEALADVYERALVTKHTRSLLGTHSTPCLPCGLHRVAAFALIAKIPPAELSVFEPGCGHAPFLVAVMRLIRNLDLVQEGPSPVRSSETGCAGLREISLLWRLHASR